MKEPRRFWFWIGLAAILVALRWVVSASTIERIYSRGIYPIIRTGLDFMLGPQPFPVMFLVFFILLVAVLVGGRSLWKAHKSWYKTLKHGLMYLVRALAMIVVWFMVFWGFNYGRESLTQQLGLKATLDSDPMKVSALQDEARRQVLVVNSLRQNLLSDVRAMKLLEESRTSLHRFAPSASDLGLCDKEDLRQAVRHTLFETGFPKAGIVPLRVLPKGFLLRWGSSGVYSPWTGEAHIDGGLHPLQIPFTGAHELFHGQGITDEGDCNFMAYLACVKSNHPWLRYSGELTYMRYLTNGLARSDREAYQQLSSLIAEDVQEDLAAIRRNMDDYEEYMPAVRTAVYEGYLRSQGVHDGLASYARIIDLVMAARAKGILDVASPPGLPRVD